MPFIFPTNKELTDTIQIGNYYNNAIYTVSLAKIWNDVSALGFNAFCLPVSTNTISGEPYIGYYDVICFNVTDETNYYVGTGTYLDSTKDDTHCVGFKYGTTSMIRYIYNNESDFRRRGSVNFSGITVDGVSYSTSRNDLDTNIPIILYIHDGYEQIYLNGQLPISYNWVSVPSVSGKNGILSLPVLVSTDGKPVSSGSESDFSVLPDGAKVRTLADLAVQ